MPPTHTACVLAAGLGTRLGPLPHPKGFLRLGGRTLIDRSLGHLRAHGIERVVIVTGHLAEFYEALEGVTTVRNAAYAHTGSLASLACAAPLLDEDFLLLESDLVYEPRALATLLEHPHPDLVLLSGPTHAGDEVFVETDRTGRLRTMSKDPARLREVAGELVGISRISRSLLADLVRAPEGAYETDGLVRCAATHDIRCPLVPDLVWAEIDDAAHLARAERLSAELL